MTLASKSPYLFSKRCCFLQPGKLEDTVLIQKVRDSFQPNTRLLLGNTSQRAEITISDIPMIKFLLKLVTDLNENTVSGAFHLLDTLFEKY